MRQMPRTAKIAAALMFISIAMTATPIVILANRVYPTIFEMPFFLVWTIAGPALAFVFSAIYTRIMNRSDEQQNIIGPDTEEG
jgi:peptidoglycan/LPS O-acetylase OafA/YrhL